MSEIKVGFIGLGDIGEGMAQTLVRKGFEVIACAHTRREAIEALKQKGGKEVTSPREVAASSDPIISVVRDSKEIDEIIFGSQGMYETLKPGATVIICSTLSPKYCQEVAAKLKGKGVHVLDAPISGGRTRAMAGTLSFMIGGEKEVFENCRPLFEAMGRDIFHLGDIGMGQVCKLCSKIILVVMTEATYEATALAQKAGIPKNEFLEVMKTTTSTCWAVENWDEYVLPYRKEYAEKGYSRSVYNMYKDLGLAVELADKLGFRVPLSALTYHLDFGEYV